MSSSNIGVNDDRQRDFELTQIRDALKGLRYGTVNIVVQDGVVVQIDRTEKKRLVRRGDGYSNGREERKSPSGNGGYPS